MSDADLRRHNRYTWMLIAFSALAIFFMAQQSRAGMFYYASEIGLTVNGSNNYYDLQGNPTANADFQGQNLGNYNLLGGSSLTLFGTKVYVYRDNGSDYINTNNTQTIYWDAWQTGSANTFTGAQILSGGPSGSSTAFLGGSNFSGQNYNMNVNIGSDITQSGSWNVGFYIYGNASYDSGGQKYYNMNNYSNNGGNNFVATITAFYGATTTATQSAAFTGSGYFNFNGSGQTYTLNANNTYSGETQIQAGTVALSGSGAVGSSSVVRIAANSTFDISGVTTSASVNALSEYGTSNGGSVKLGSKTLIMKGGTASTTYQMKSIGVSGDTGEFTLNAANSSVNLRLYGTGASSSTYTGKTTVQAGTLTLAGTLASTAIDLTGGNLTTESGNAIDDNAVITLSSANSTLTIGGSDTIGYFGGTTGNISITGTLTTGTALDSSFAGVLAGNGSLIKQGAGTLTLSGATANTYSGTTTINNGTVVLQKTAGVNAIAGTPTINSGGTLKLGAGDQFAGDTTFLTINSGGTFDMNGFNDTLALQGAGTIKLGSGTLVINPTSSTGDNFSGDIQGTGGITKANTGIQVLSGASTYSGATAVNAGTLEIRNASALGTTAGSTTVANNAALNYSNATSMTVAENLTLNGTGVGGVGGSLKNVAGSNTQSGTVTLGSSSRIAATGGSLAISGNISGRNNVLFLGANGGDLSVSSIISGTGASQNGTVTSLFKDGANTLTLTGANTYSGDTRITQGILTVNSGGSLGDGTSDVFISANATLNVNANTTVDSVRETGNSDGGVVAIGSGATLTVGGVDKGLHYQNSISGAGNFTMNGSGTTTLGLYGTQSYTGNTTVSGGKLTSGVTMATAGVTVNGGTFETTADNILNSTSKNVTVNGGTYDVKGTDLIGRLSGTGGTTAIASGKTLTASYGANASYGGTISGAGTFQKSGASQLTLASGSSVTVSTIAVQQGTLLLGANNQIGNTTGITMSGGTLNTGGFADVVGKLTVSANSTIQGMNSTSGSAFTFSDIDLGSYSTSGGSTLTFLPTSGTYSQGTVIQLSSVAASSWTGYGDGTSLNNFSQKISFSDANLRAQINFGGGTSGTTLTVAAIPEPKVYAAAAVLIFLIGWAEFRRRRKKTAA